MTLIHNYSPRHKKVKVTQIIIIVTQVHIEKIEISQKLKSEYVLCRLHTIQIHVTITLSLLVHLRILFSLEFPPKKKKKKK